MKTTANYDEYLAMRASEQEKVQRLYIGGNNTISAIPDNLPVGLQHLNIGGNNTISAIPDNLPSGLQHLYIGGYNTISVIPDNLPTGLQRLYIWGNNAISAIPDNLPTGLQTLNIGGSNNTISVIPDNLPSGLQYIDIWGNNTISAGISDSGKVLYADGIWSRVLSHRGNVFHVRNIGADKDSYVVRDGDKWAHGDTLAEAREDLIYKIGDRDTSHYESMTADAVLTHAEAIECYRVITGACSTGTRSFAEQRLGTAKQKSYTIARIAELTIGQYGNDTFKKFFNIK